MKVGIVAGEKSGDYLGAELIKAITVRYPEAEFIGLAGPLMQAEGAKSLADMDKISIMGVGGAIKGLFEILAIRKHIRQTMLQWRPDVFIGIDVPDFNLRLEIDLKAAGIPTVHYVSPTVWAWRSKRIFKIKRAVHLMLTLFPFEERFYQKHSTPVKFVGHPLAKQVQNWRVGSKEQALILPDRSKKLVAVLPGSRMSEVSKLAPLMLDACSSLAKHRPDLSFVLPAASTKIENYLQSQLNISQTPVKMVSGLSRDVLSSSHIAMLASGTAALEAGLFAVPMVVIYKVAKIERWVWERTIVTDYFSMPNHLTELPVVPELIQDNATVENLVAEMSRLLNNQTAYQQQKQALETIVPLLSQDSGAIACDAIEHMLEKHS